ncbi:ABC transporter substrate-binding protein [Thermococcus indicus]|uniref:ABC transporter substrate-binding protein n=1 Tax=Thermococcus indicus TaxID=2586643 RepID=A0A4Y5SLY1_9EURY|nr:ABC transporter substrate-binding protein [Thermococcus indicus]QDA31374.1 ABC transporter substrate-binding protein [Thermococcus indicus]
MKKLVGIFLAVLIVFSTGCLGGGEEAPSETLQTKEESPVQETSPTQSAREGSPTKVSPTPTAPEGTSLTDAVGRTVELELPVKRAIVLPSTALEVVHILRAEEQVAGVSMAVMRNGLLPESLKAKPIVSRSVTIEDWEKVIELNPDVIINLHFSGMFNPEEFAKKAENHGIPVVFLREEKLEDVAKTFEIMGKLFRKEDRAKEFMDYFNAQVNEVKEISAQIGERRMVIIIQPIMGKLYLINGNDILAEVVRLIGGEYAVNVTVQGRMPVRVQMDKEKIISNYKDVDVIILTTSPMTKPEDVEKLKEEMLNDAVWKGMKAVKEGRVVVLRSDLGKGSYFRWGPRMAVGMWQVGRAVYPEHYPDWKDKEKEFLERFYGQG